MSNRNKKKNPEVKCSFDAMVPIDQLSEFPNNYNEHGDQQLELLGKIITEQGWRNPVVVSKRSNYVIRGHGRIDAARRIGLTEVPVDYQDYDSDVQEKLDLVADNQIAKLADPNHAVLSELLLELDANNVDMDLSGFDHNALVDYMLPVMPTDAESPYSNKTVAPIYEAKEAEAPPVNQMFDDIKVNHLLDKISKTELEPEIREFLTLASYRHAKFDFGKIAEFYCHADPSVQQLMQDSALVIIDFDKAIEENYVTLRSELIEQYSDENDG